MYDQEYVRIPKSLMNELRRTALKTEQPTATLLENTIRTGLSLEQQAIEEQQMTRYERGLETA